ncbi:MAG: DNA sulfur modification protein DndE [Victivallaceae bacterium]|nr:DNA sulfur modification protein DndE [Victivallaceae bacterium]
MIIETVRISQKAKDQLVKLKRITGIQNWNVLCRWALCTSLADSTPLESTTIKTDSSIEMDWKTFTGKEGAIIEAMIRQSAKVAGTAPPNHLSNHLHRGIINLSSTENIILLIRTTI